MLLSTIAALTLTSFVMIQNDMQAKHKVFRSAFQLVGHLPLQDQLTLHVKDALAFCKVV